MCIRDRGNSGSLLVVVVLLLSSNSLDRLVTPLLFIFVVLSDPKLILTLVFVEKDFVVDVILLSFRSKFFAFSFSTLTVVC